MVCFQVAMLYINGQMPPQHFTTGKLPKYVSSAVCANGILSCWPASPLWLQWCALSSPHASHCSHGLCGHVHPSTASECACVMGREGGKEGSIEGGRREVGGGANRPVYCLSVCLCMPVQVLLLCHRYVGWAARSQHHDNVFKL